MSSYEKLKKQRLEQLYQDCQQHVISQVIGPFGLSVAMFEDRNGGNVTTVKNFSRDDADYIAEKDVESHEILQEVKNGDWEKNRAKYESDDWTEKSESRRAKKIDEYTGKKVDSEKQLQLDHVNALKPIATSSKIIWRLIQGKTLMQ